MGGLKLSVRTCGLETPLLARKSSQILLRGSMRLGKTNGSRMENVHNVPLQRRGWLRNGNCPGDFSKAPRCGAKTRRGSPCKSPAMANGRCRMHGGTSTGPKTPAGLEASRKARWVHGGYSAEAETARKAARQLIRDTWEFLKRSDD